MLSSIPPAVRRVLPPIVLSVAAVSSLVVALQLLLLAPDYPHLAASFFGAACLKAVGAYGLYRQRFWARGFGIGALVSSGVSVGVWFTSEGVAIGTTLLAILLLVADDAPGQYERRTAFLEQRKLDRAGARRLFFVSLGLGVGLPALLGTTLSIQLLLEAPIPFGIAAGLGILGFWGLTRLSSWCYFAIAGSVVSLVVAVVLTVLDGFGSAATWGAILAAMMGAALLPLTGPIVRALSPRR